MSAVALIGPARVPTIYRRTSELQACNAPMVGYMPQRLPTDPAGSAVLTLTGLQPGSDIVVLIAGSENELLNVDAHATASYGWFSDRFAAPTTVDIGVFKAGFVPFYVRGYTLASTDATLPIAQVPDRNYRNPT